MALNSTTTIFTVLTCLLIAPAQGSRQCRKVLTSENLVVVSEGTLETENMTLQEAIDCAPAGGTVQFEGNVSMAVPSTMVLNRPVVILSDRGGLKSELGCGKEGPLLNISSSGVIIMGLHFVNCSLEVAGSSAVVVDIPVRSSTQEDVVFSNVHFVNNKNKYGPGALLIKSADLVVLENTTFSNNEGLDGGALEVTSSSIELLLSGCNLQTNRALRWGGAMYYNPLDQENEELSAIIIRNSTFEGNSAMNQAEGTASGGAIALGVSHLSLLMTQSHLTNNRASGYGGALWLNPSSLSRDVHIALHETVLVGNQASYGGAVALGLPKARCTISSCVLVDNRATAKVLMRDGIAKGGAMFLVQPESVLIKNTMFKGNLALPLEVAEKGNDRKLLQMPALRNSTAKETTTDDPNSGEQEMALDAGDHIHLHRADDPLEQYGWDKFAGPDADEMLKHTSGAAGGAIFLLGLGLQQNSRVLRAPVSSNCSKQCVPNPPESLNIEDPVDGCGLMGDHRVCMLRDNSTCRSFEKVQRLYVKPSGPWVAVCTVDAHGTSLEVVDSQFVNSVSDNGGAIAVINGAALFLHGDMKFLNNTAEKHGGAIFAGSETKITAQGTSFAGNRAEHDGGGIVLKGQNCAIVLGSADLHANVATKGSGGAISVQGPNALIDVKPQVVFSANKADLHGGAIAIETRTTLGTFKSTVFDSNRATLGGGAFYAKAGSGAARITLSDVDFRYNSVASSQDVKLRQGGVGGAMLLDGMAVDVVLAGTQNSFIRNEAGEGGAIRIINAGGFEAETALFQFNNALTGGGIHVTFTEKENRKTFVLRNSTFEDNGAFMGGGLMADAKTARGAFILDDALSSTVFGTYDEVHSSNVKIELYGLRMSRQSAVHSGGGMLLMDIEALCEYCEFANNRVEEIYKGGGGAISLQDAAILSIETSVFTENKATFGGAVHSKNSVFLAKDARFSHNTAYHSGGAIAVESRLRTYGQLQTVFELHSSVVESNDAVVGGGIHVNILPWHHEDVCGPLSQTSGLEPNMYERVVSDIQGHCEMDTMRSGQSKSEFVQMKEVTIWKNEAEEAGGGLFVSSPDYVCACCSGQCTSACTRGFFQEIEVRTLDKVCPDLWTGNSVQQYGYGDMIATLAVRSDIRFEDGEEWSMNEELMEHTSGAPLKPFEVRLLDAFGQVTSNTPQNLFVKLWSERGILSGQVDKEIDKGVAKFASTVVTAPPALHILRIVLPVELNIGHDLVSLHIRNCTRGEQAFSGDFGSFRCEACAEGTIGVLSGGPCEPCPNGLECAGQSAVPVDGYWHGSSHSLTAKMCLSEEGCLYSGRVSVLKQQSMASEEAVSYKGNYTLCRQGYTGVLCGSCQVGYERSGAFDCRKCMGNQISLWLGIAVAVWLILVVAFVIRASLWPYNRNADRLYSRRESVEASRTTHSVFSLSREYSGMPNNVLTSAENVKILVNFLQVSSLVMTLNTRWTQETRVAFEIEDVLSGISASRIGLLWLRCTDKALESMSSAKLAVLGLLFPLAIALLTVVFWSVRSIVAKKCFLHRGIASLLVVLYVFYLGAAKRAFSIFHLVQVEGIPDASDGSIEPNRFWAEDTSYEYFQGSHLVLVFLSLAFVVTWILAFPIGLLIFLMLNPESLEEHSFSERYGFLYNAYKKSCWYWEAIVMLRKAMLAAVAVFMFSLNSNLQCSIALLIMIASLTAHLAVQPYKSELAEMRNKETMSLCGSTFIYLVALVLKDDGVCEAVRFVLSVVSVSVSVGLASFFALSMVLRGMWVLDGAKRPAGGVRILSRMNFFRRLKLNMQDRWHAHMSRLWEQIGELFLQNLDDADSVSGLGDEPAQPTQPRPYTPKFGPRTLRPSSRVATVRE